MLDTNESIDIHESIPLVLAIINPKTGQPVKGTLSAVEFQMDNEIGEITPDSSTPNQWIFTPTKAGTTHITATATITVS